MRFFIHFLRTCNWSQYFRSQLWRQLQFYARWVSTLSYYFKMQTWSFPFLLILEDDSPYLEVRSAVANFDDPEMPASTIRAWILGITWAILISGMNQFFYYRYPSVAIGNVRPRHLYRLEWEMTDNLARCPAPRFPCWPSVGETVPSSVNSRNEFEPWPIYYQGTREIFCRCLVASIFDNPLSSL